jgi:predicted nucleic acid-binding protein
VAVVAGIFFDTTILLAGLIDMGPPSAASQQIMTAIARGTIKRPATSWHCCLEFYSVSTRLPPELRLSPHDAVRLSTEEILARFAIHDLPPSSRGDVLKEAAADSIAGGRIYDLHIATVARASGVKIIVTDNPRHFSSLLRHGLRVLTAKEFIAEFLQA